MGEFVSSFHSLSCQALYIIAYLPNSSHGKTIQKTKELGLYNFRKIAFEIKNFHVGCTPSIFGFNGI
jgi:hypothetical protein